VFNILKRWLLMAGNNFAWIRIMKSDKKKMESYFKPKGVTSHYAMFKLLLRNKK